MADESVILRPDLEYPRIRSVEALPMPDGSRQEICLRDPRQIAKNILILPPPVFFIATLFDGTNSLRDIQQIFARKYGDLIPLAKITEIVLRLDRELFLESETFESQRLVEVEAFRSSPVRKAAHAGTAYAAEPGELRQSLNGFLDAIRAKKPVDALPEREPLSLLIAPHIDLRRGGECFAFAYRELARHEPADLYLVLGTGHHSESSILALTRTSYTTPLGTIETDVEFVEQVSREAPFDVFEEEILHRNEHSVEFQILWLRHALGSSWRGKVVPILCGSFHSFIVEGRSPRENEKVAKILNTLRATIDAYPGRIAVIAGVDFSHVGQRFGHSSGIPSHELERVRNNDGEIIQSLRTGNAEAFFQAVEKKKDRNNICGLSPIYMSLDIARAGKGRLLNYDRAIEEDTQSVVTYASMAFYR